jgi:short-subunit dehydrogenase
VDLSDYKHLFDINFWGTIYCTKHFLPDLKKENDSRLVNIISDFALMGFSGKTTYSSSKSAVMGFSNSLKTELADTNVKVCLVIPPLLDTLLVKNSNHIDNIKRENEALFLKKNGMRLDKAAQRIIRQIRKGKYRIIIGTMMFWIDLASRLFPTTLHNLISKNKKRFDFI